MPERFAIYLANCFIKLKHRAECIGALVLNIGLTTIPIAYKSVHSKYKHVTVCTNNFTTIREHWNPVRELVLNNNEQKLLHTLVKAKQWISCTCNALEYYSEAADLEPYFGAGTRRKSELFWDWRQNCGNGAMTSVHDLFSKVNCEKPEKALRTNTPFPEKYFVDSTF